MEQSLIVSTLQNGKAIVLCTLDMIEWEDKGCYFLFSPALDLTGYGNTKKKAEDSFQITLTEFFAKLLAENLLEKELKSIGWNIANNSFSHPPVVEFPHSEILSKIPTPIYTVRRNKELQLQA